MPSEEVRKRRATEADAKRNTIVRPGDVLKRELDLLESLSTGDEIHFTDGTIWCCTFQRWFEDDPNAIVVLVPKSFAQLKEDEWSQHTYFPSDFKSLLIDAVKGGASVKKGVGLAH